MKNITSKDNPLIKHIIKLNKSAKYRRENNEFTAEGIRLCLDALSSGAEINSLILSENSFEKYPRETSDLMSKCKNSYIVPDSLFSRVSDTKNPQGVLCVIKTLDKPLLFDKMVFGGKYVALENIQDPSNLGTVLRTAEAVGVNGVILSNDCCDIYSPKVIRGSMGAVFRLPVMIVDSIEQLITENKNINFYASVVDESAKKITEIKFEEPAVVIIGNEGNGIKAATLSVCENKFTIPMNGRAESLNASAAAAIIIWELIK